jgi:hypothetical protein
VWTMLGTGKENFIGVGVGIGKRGFKGRFIGVVIRHETIR